MHSSTLSRTSSAASISSDDAARRTRKRFTSVQLVLLEQLFHQTSHPTRDEREAVAHAAGMEVKSVTIWFQNKRQTERKVALHHAAHPADAQRPSGARASSPPALPAPAGHPVRPHARALSLSHPAAHTHAHVHTPRRRPTPPRARPSLDRIAARSESRRPAPALTRPPDPHAAPWDNMPSSPVAPASPPARELVDFGSARTLEWACAAARLAGKEGRRRRARARLPHGGQDQYQDQDQGQEREGEDTEEEDVEAITPEGSLGAADAARWCGVHSQPAVAAPGLSGAPPAVRTATSAWEAALGQGPKDVPQDEDTMRAALALCGLGRRSA